MNNDTSQADDTELADSQHSTPVYPLAGVLLAGGVTWLFTHKAEPTSRP